MEPVAPLMTLAPTPVRELLVSPLPGSVMQASSPSSFEFTTLLEGTGIRLQDSPSGTMNNVDQMSLSTMFDQTSPSSTTTHTSTTSASRAVGGGSTSSTTSTHTASSSSSSSYSSMSTSTSTTSRSSSAKRITMNVGRGGDGFGVVTLGLMVGFVSLMYL
ncbi:hypothetical protein HDU76_003879 [Blyttiomyces sp. JEL0837]|nr:hypothetical protein HDU76_003879 [Blyttiomyces sp. JEL0837]